MVQSSKKRLAGPGRSIGLYAEHRWELCSQSHSVFPEQREKESFDMHRDSDSSTIWSKRRTGTINTEFLASSAPSERLA